MKNYAICCFALTNELFSWLTLKEYGLNLFSSCGDAGTTKCQKKTNWMVIILFVVAAMRNEKSEVERELNVCFIKIHELGVDVE